MSIISTILGVESGGRNVTQGNIGDINNANGTLAQGYFQITDPTWAQFGGLATGYTSAIQAPYDVQLQIAKNIPITRWGPNTIAALNAQGVATPRGQTLGDVLNANGQGATGSGVTMNADQSDALFASAANQGIGSDTPNLTDADFAGLQDSDVTDGTAALGNDQGTPNLGGGLNTGAGGIAGGQPVDITDLPGLDTSVSGAGKAVQQGATTAGSDVQTAAGGIAGTAAGITNALSGYASNALVVVALVLLGLVFVAFGLGMFKHNLAAAV